MSKKPKSKIDNPYVIPIIEDKEFDNLIERYWKLRCREWDILLPKLSWWGKWSYTIRKWWLKGKIIKFLEANHYSECRTKRGVYVHLYSNGIITMT